MVPAGTLNVFAVAPATIRETFTVVSGTIPSLAVTRKLYVPSAGGVPWNRPVVVLNVAQPGSPVAV